MENIGKEINSSYCGGLFSNNYDLLDAMIEGEGKNWMVVRTTDGEVYFEKFLTSGHKRDCIREYVYK